MTATLTKLGTLKQAYDGSYYTILGTGGDLTEWVEGIEGLLAEQGIGKPVEWFETTGAMINDFAFPGGWTSDQPECFQPDLPVLMFPLDGLDLGKLPLFKLLMGDRWFDDVIDNMKGVEQ